MIRLMDLAGYRPSPAPKKKESEDEFSVIDALAGGTGRFLEHVGAIAEDVTRPDNMTPEQWREHASPWMQALQNEGRAMAERNYHPYEDGSVNYHLQNILMSTPESLAIMAGSLAAGAPVGGLLGAGANFVRSALPQAGRIGGMLFDLAKAYQSAGTAGKLARTITPASPQAFASAEIGAGLEARVEQYEAEQRFIENAKRNGTYVQGQTEQQAREIGNNVFWDNMGIISMFNAPQYNMLLGKAPKSLLGKAGQIIGAGAAEGSEEIAQELAAAHELGEPAEWRNIRDSGIAGLGMGIGMHGAGRAARYGYNRATGQPTDEEIDAYIERQKSLRKDASKAEADFYHDTFRGNVQDAINRQDEYREDTARQSYNDALKESRLQRRLPALRSWADKHSGGQMSDTVFDSIVRNAQEIGVPVERALATAIAESNGNQDVTSGAGAIGVMQLMPETAQELGVDPNDTEQNIRGGIQYLKQQYDRFGDWNLAHAAYNAGAGNVEKAGNRVPAFYETQNYVAKINGFMGNSPAGREGVEQSDINGGSIYKAEGITYLGDNGKGEGRYWVRQGDNVSFDGAQPDLLNAVDMLGKMFYERTGKKLVVTAGTNGQHADGEHSHGAGWKVDIADAGANGVALDEDGALFTSGYRAQPFLKEFIAYGRSLGLGMNLEAEGTPNVHIDVALDGTQWDGNGDNAGGFNRNNVSQSRVEEIFNERYDPNKIPVPQWEQARVDTDTSLRAGDESNQRSNEQEEPASNQNPQDLFSGIFSNTNTSQNQQNTPEDVIAATDDFLEKLRTDGNKPETLLELQTARRSGDIAKMGNILRQNGIAIPSQQLPAPKPQPEAQPKPQVAPPPQETSTPPTTATPSPQSQPQAENVVQNNQPPEKILPSPQPQQTKEQKQEQAHINRVRKSVRTGVENREARSKQGKSIIWLAEKNGIEIPDGERHGLEIGAPNMIRSWRDKLLEAGILKSQPAPVQDLNQNTPPPTEPPAPPVSEEQRQWDNIKQGYQERGGMVQKARGIMGIDPPHSAPTAQSNIPENVANVGLAEALKKARKINGLDEPRVDQSAAKTNDLYAAEDRGESQSSWAENIPSNVRFTTATDERARYAEAEKERQDKAERERQESERARREQQQKENERYADIRAKYYDNQNTPLETNEADIRIAHAPISESNAARAEQGRAILRVFYSAPFRNVQLPAGLEQSLSRGDIKAIETAQGLLEQAEHANYVESQHRARQQRKSVKQHQQESARILNEEEYADDQQFVDEMIDSLVDEVERREELFNDLMSTADEQEHQQNAKNAELERRAQKARDKALAPISESKSRRKEQGRAIKHFLKAPSLKAASDKINATPGLMRGVEEGYKQALHDALQIINDEINAQNEARETARREREAAEARRNEPSEQEKQDAERRADRRRRDVRDEQADETALSAQENDIDRRYQNSQRATENAQQGLMQSTAESVQESREQDRARREWESEELDDRFNRYDAWEDLFGNEEETRSGTKENVTRQEHPEGDSDVFDLLPESDELNDVEEDEVQPQPEKPPQIEPPIETLKPKRKRSKKADALHKKFKTDTYPLFGEYLDNLFKRAASKENTEDRKAALRELKIYETREAPTDEVLDRVENQLQEEKEEREEDEAQSTADKEVLSSNSQRWVELYNSAKERLEKALDAEKYPELEEYIDDRLFTLKPNNLSLPAGYIRKTLRQRESSLIAEAEEVGKVLFAAGALLRNFQNSYFRNGLEHEVHLARSKEAGNVIKKAKEGEIPAEEAYRQVKEILYGTDETNRTAVSKRNDTHATATEPQTQQPKPEAESQNIVTFERKGNDATEIQQGRKAIQNSPNGTIIYGKWIGFGVNSEERYLISSGKLQRINENGQRKGVAVKLSPTNIRKHFGQSSLVKLELTYPEGYKESTQPSEKFVINTKVEMPDGRIAPAAEITFLGIGLNKSEHLTTPENLRGIDEIAKKYGGENVQRDQRYPQWKVFVFENENRRNNFKKNANEFLNGELAKLSTQENSRTESVANAPLQTSAKKVRDANEIDEYEERAKNAKHSKQGNVDTEIRNLVDDKDLTPQQKLLKSFGGKLGVKTLFFEGGKKFHGKFEKGTIYVNVNSGMPIDKVFWHESFHWLRNNNPELYNELVKAAGISTEQRQAYLTETERTDIRTPDEINEEVLADMMDDVAKRTGLFQSIAGKNRGLIERVIQWLKDTMNKFIDHFRNPQGKLTTVQAQALADEFGKIANQLKDSNGNQIFRYNRRTHNVELVDNRERTESEINAMTAKNARFPAKYSIDASDNSNESFKQRLKNFFGVNRRNEAIHKTMKRQLEDLSGMKIAADHLPEGVQVKIDKIAKVIRTGREYDWANVLPEVGNAVAEQLKITQSAEMGNYIAKFILDGAPNDTSAEANEFAKAMREKPEMRDKVMAIRETFDTWNNMSTEEQMIASTRYEKETPPLKERAKDLWRYLRTQMFDTQMPIHYHVAKFEKATGLKLSESVNPEIAFRNLRGMQQRAMRMVFGNENTGEVLQKFYPNVDFSGWKPIAVILESIKASPDTQKFKQFDMFVKARHFLDLHQHNDNVLMQQNQVRDEIKKLQDELAVANTKKTKAELERLIHKKEESLDALKKKIMDTPDAFTKDKCAEIILKYDDEFGAAQKDLVQYSRTLLAIMADSGIISRQRYHQLLNAYPNYVPLHREFDENPDLNTADSMKHMLGSSKDMGDSIAAISNNTFDYIQRAEKNKAKLLLANLANFDGVGGIFELIDGSTPNDGTIIHFYENGKRKALQCSDKDIVESVNTMNTPTMNLFLRVLHVPALILRATATGVSPSFILGNFLRDPQDAFIFSKGYGGAKAKDLVKDLGKAFNPFVTGKYMLEAARMGKLFEEYAVSGGAQADFFSFDRDYKAEAIERLTKKNYQRYATPKGLIELLGKLGEWTELATRLRQYEKVKTTRAEEHGGINIYDDLVAAAFESRDLIDFARHGQAGHTWNTLTAFANPVLQGFDKQWRTYDFAKLKKFGGTEQTEKEWKISVARLFLGSVLPALVLALLHKDEDWYKEDVQDWEKENYWILNKYLRVPKGADVGVRFFSNLTERLISNDPVKADKVLQPLKGILPDLMPTAFLPIFECMANYDLFRRKPIVPQREINKFKDTPELQYDSQNSKLAVLIGRSVGVSPRYIDHMIYGYASGAGREAMHILDTVTPGRHEAWTRRDIPFFSRILRTPYRNPKIVSDYYEELGRQESLAQRVAWEKQHGNPNAKPPAEYDPALHRRLKNIQRAMQNLNSHERAMMDDPKLTSEQVYEKREEFQKKRVELCKRAFQQAR